MEGVSLQNRWKAPRWKVSLGFKPRANVRGAFHLEPTKRYGVALANPVAWIMNRQVTVATFVIVKR